ncbi:MAG: hypothetical protein A2018_04300 [Alphaproteobacteria bacterium GWF2_58_20]|nr:MAG: hypothetical protein A2018_04300 [Alphaproteobacteria bacterium GWF2_58_20]
MVSSTRILTLAAACCAALSLPALAGGDVRHFLASLKVEALAAGVSSRTFDEAMSGFSPVSRIVELDRSQPEGRKSFAEYRKTLLSEKRITQGRRLYVEEKGRLSAMEKAYGVPAHVVVALWGIETNYGAIMGGFSVPHALGTLAMDGRRPDFFRGELVRALRIIEHGHVSVANMKGSWAGAMGQVQFMPSSFETYAVDANGDGRRDIWSDRDDIFASAANYLAKSGWKTGEPWGVPVRLPAGLDAGPLAGLDKTLPLEAFKEMGIASMDGKALNDLPAEASLVMPDGPTGAAFLVFNNYRVFMKWNRSTYFATAVGLLSDQIGAS